MHIRLVRSCLTSRGHQDPGSVVDVPEKEAALLIAIRKAVAHDGDAPAAAAAPQVATIDDTPPDLPQGDDSGDLTTTAAAAVVAEDKRPRGRPRKSR